jgi:hypothetical protein
MSYTVAQKHLVSYDRLCAPEGDFFLLFYFRGPHDSGGAYGRVFFCHYIYHYIYRGSRFWHGAGAYPGKQLVFPIELKVILIPYFGPKFCLEWGRMRLLYFFRIYCGIRQKTKLLIYISGLTMFF